MHERSVPPAKRIHLEAMTGPLGIWQHASGTLPDESFGYCTDDVARALAVDLYHRRVLGWEAVSASAWRSFTFLRDAFDPEAGTFRNFRAADGTWLDAGGSQDSQGRALLALGTAAAEAPEVAMRHEAATLFTAALPVARRLGALRAVASALLGCDAALGAGVEGETDAVFDLLAARLRRAFDGADRTGATAWPWPEPIVTYENALLPRALIVASRRRGDAVNLRAGIAVLDWLCNAQTSPAGRFSPIGNTGWWPRGGIRSHFDQQPIEATATILAAVAAYEATGEERFRRFAATAYGWFLGDNDAGIPVADVVTGGCYDGLSETCVNANQGAESTMMWLTAQESMRMLRSGVRRVTAHQPSTAVGSYAAAVARR